MANFTALHDARVLYPATRRDFLMSLAETNLFRARRTDRIHDEWMRNLLADRTDLTRQQVERTRQFMDAAVPDCLISGYEDLIAALELPDADDRHVLAAAIRGRVDVIVTLNLKDFPPPPWQPTTSSRNTRTCSRTTSSTSIRRPFAPRRSDIGGG